MNNERKIPDDVTSNSESAAAGSADLAEDLSLAESAEESAVVDELPADLQPALVDPDEYVFPNNNRRRIPAYLYLGISVALVAIYAFARTSILVNEGYLFAAAILGALGIYSFVAGWDLKVDEREALVASVAKVGFPVGHASAQMGWRGLLSRPTWRILVYSADEPPSKRGLVMVDGVNGEVTEFFVEDNPEDWSEVD